jgi:hypothetical protein
MIKAGMGILMDFGAGSSDHPTLSGEVLVRRIFETMMDCRHGTQRSGC